jgi:hypothetical protein
MACPTRCQVLLYCSLFCLFLWCEVALYTSTSQGLASADGRGISLRPSGCQCEAIGSVAGGQQQGRLCSLDKLYQRGYDSCAAGCLLFPSSALTGGSDACVSLGGGASPVSGAEAGLGSVQCPPLPLVHGVRVGAYLVCAGPFDWVCMGATAAHLAERLSTPDFPVLYHPACLLAGVHPRIFLAGTQSLLVQSLAYDASDVRLLIDSETDGLPAQPTHGALPPDIAVTGTLTVPHASLAALGDTAGLQLYLPFVAFGVLQNAGQSELDLLRSPPASASERPYFAAYATSHCRVAARSAFYPMLQRHRPVHALNQDCHGGPPPPGGPLGDRRDEQGWAASLAQRLSAYKFALVFENGIVPGYVSEKLAIARRAGAVPVYWGSSVAPQHLFNPAAFVDCSPTPGQSVEEALEACAARVVALDADHAAWSAMVQAPFMLHGQPLDYGPLGRVVRGVLECKRLGGCGGLHSARKAAMVCAHIEASPLMRLDYYVPDKFGGCSSVRGGGNATAGVQ